MTYAILRADGSSGLGMGHIMRCLAFADRLKDAGTKPVFVTKAFERTITTIIQSRGYEVEEISPEASAEDDAWLTRGIAGRKKARLIVTDLCHWEALAKREELSRYHESLAEDYFMVSLAGGDVIDLPANILVSPYFRTKYPDGVIDGRGIRLLGPSYFIFRREFTSAAKLPRKIAKEGKQILVAIAGSDPFQLTAKVGISLCAIRRAGLSVRITLGHMYSDGLKETIERILADFEGEWAFLDSGANMADAMLWADLAITGDGLTKYETAVTGTPSIMLSTALSERALNEEFEKAGTSLHLGDGGLISIAALAGKIQEVLQDASIRSSMSDRGRKMVDGLGLERIIAKIPSSVLT